jgi:carbon-monoxide dehydrogenase small subunit
MLMAAYGFLLTHPAPTEDEIREGLSAVLCRCTGYQGIVEAVKAAAGKYAGSVWWMSFQGRRGRM